MNRFRPSNLQYLLLALLLMALTGCGAGNTALNSDNSGPGSITAKMVWGAAAGKSTAKAVAAVPAGVVNLQLTVVGTGANGPLPVVRSTIAVTGSDAGGSVNGVYPGKVTLTAKALDSTGAVLYEGFALNAVITAGATTDVGTITMSAPLTKAQDANCVSCHETTLDATGQSLVADFKQSGHYGNSSWTGNDKFGVTGTGCAGCHGPSHNDPTPSANGRCLECHGPVLNPAHFNNFSGAGAHAAMYVSTNYQKNCSACHEPHNPIEGKGKAERQAWAESAHGDVNGVAWSSEDMQAAGQIACQRCHTATGFKNFAISNFKTFTATDSVALPGDKTRQVLACDACHSDNNFTVRKVGAFTAQYTIGGKAATFPEAGESNLCIACHSARENGVDAVSNFTNASFKNSHYLPAAGLMYMSTGFTQFTSASAAFGTSTYGKSLTADSTSVPAYGIAGGVGSTHRKLGTTMITGDGHNQAVFIKGQFDANGPCVTCHMNASNAPTGTRAAHGHSLEIDENTYNQVCTNCHVSENTVPLTSANFKSVFIEPQSEAYQAALKLAVSLLQSKNIEYDAAAYPYFFKGGMSHVSANAVKDWTLGSTDQVFGKKLMGACFNIQLLTKDPAAFAHARSYSRRLLYDSIDFLDDGVINQSVGATALASGLLDGSGQPLFAKGARAYNADSVKTGTSYPITTIASGTSEAMLYLIGWTRSGSTSTADDALQTNGGVWTTIERP